MRIGPVTVAGLLLLGPTAVAGGTFALKPSEARIEIGGRAVAATSVRAVETGTLSVGSLRIVADRNRVRAVDATTGAERWIASLPPGRRVEILAATERVAYARWWTGGGPHIGILDSPDRLRRLSLGDGTWLEPWTVEGGRIRSVAVEGSMLLVVSDPGEGTWRATAFEEGRPGHVWSRTFRSPPRPGRPLEHMADFARTPRFAGAVSSDVVVAGPLVVLCAGHSQEIVAVDRVSGEIEWQVDRIWEFERHLGDVPNSLWDISRAKGREERAALARDCRIVAGPFVVPHDGGYRLFVAVDRDRAEQTEAPVSEGLTYEIVDGDVHSVTRLPRAVLGSGSVATAGGVLWHCEEDALAFQEPSHQQHGGFRGSGQTDRRGRLRWYREPSEPVVTAWLRTSRRRACLTLAAGAAFPVAAGPYVAAPGDGVFRVPLRRLDLVSGAETDLTLALPFGGDLLSWESTSRQSEGAKGEETRVDIWHEWGVRVARMAAVGDRLEIEVAPDGGTAFGLSFSLEALR